MARKNTLSMLSNKLDEQVQEIVAKEEIEVKKEKPVQSKKQEVAKANKEVSKTTKTQTKASKKPALFQKKIEKATNVTKTFRVNKEVVEILEDLIRDPETKKIAPNMMGIMSKIINNALIKELIELDILDESYKSYIEEYQ